MNESFSPDPLRSRRRLVEEWLLESARWRDNLDDLQAQRLMNWARSYVNSVVDETAALTNDEFEDVIDGVVTAVLRVMRAINSLAPMFSQLDEESARQQLRTFSAALPSISLSPIPEEKIEQMLSQRPLWDAQTTFDTLIWLLTTPIEEETTEEEE